MLLEIHSKNPNDRHIKQVVDCLKKDGIIIYPTDTVYGIACSLHSSKAQERIARLKAQQNQPKNKLNFSLICHDLSQISDFTQQFEKSLYRLLNKNLPGPFTFILKANNAVPKIFKAKKKTIGLRVPDNNIARQIIEMLGHPILSTSLKYGDDEDEVAEYLTDPELIYEKYEKLVDIVIDGGIGDNEPSTILDCTSNDGNFEIIRQGKGEIQ